MHFSLQNDLSELDRLPDHLERFSQETALSSLVISRLNLLLEELATNAMKYGFQGSETDRMDIEISQRNDAVYFRFRDNGRPYNPLEVPAPDLDLSLEESVPGGLGLHLVQTLADDIGYRFDDGWNEVNIRLDLLNT
jgi:anti-sigma regulatory factor (Ser/Thr protein kinase)